MLRESGKQLPRLAVFVCLVLAGGCLTNVKGDSKSGKDYRDKGAKKIELEDGEGRSRRDIVTYPGGDRIDWKKFEIPEGPRGTLRIKLKWRPARPGMDLSFNVYDQYFHRIARARPSKRGKRSKKATIRNAGPGTYFVQVYASKRKDAGSYRVSLRFNEQEKMIAQAAPGEVPEPPTLPAVPEPKPEIENPLEPPPDEPNPKPEIPPVPGRVVKYQLSSSGSLIITVDRGKNSGIERGWTGKILNSAGNSVQGGTFKITKVTGNECIGKVRLSVDQLKANKKVLLTAPR